MSTNRDLEPYEAIGKIMHRDIALGFIDHFDANHAKEVQKTAEAMREALEKLQPGSRSRAAAEKSLDFTINKMVEGSRELSLHLRVRFASQVGLDPKLLPPFEQPLSERPSRFFRILNIPEPKNYNKGKPKWEPF